MPTNRGLTPEQVRADRDKRQHLRWQVRHLPNDWRVDIEIRTQFLVRGDTGKPIRVIVTGGAHINGMENPVALSVVTPVDTGSIANGDNRVIAWLLHRLQELVKVKGERDG